MKVKKVYLNDDGVLIPGHLVKRIFRKPVFFPFDEDCGFNSQVIYDKNAVLEKNTTNKEFSSEERSLKCEILNLRHELEGALMYNPEIAAEIEKVLRKRLRELARLTYYKRFRVVSLKTFAKREAK